MTELLRLIRTTIFGGVVFIVPLVLVGIIINKVYQFIKRIIVPFMPGDDAIGGIGLHAIIAILILLAICFGAGLLARTNAARNFVKWLESNILEIMPGYKFMKGMGLATTGLEDQDMKVVLARVDDGWQISFLIEQINDTMYTVYIPGAPSPWSGSIYHLEKDKIIWTDITQKQAIRCIKQLGAGYKDVLNKKLGVDVR
ncbi:MAG TPA: DUF502 domain-containing protein [Chitinophagaceae bacterium]